MPCTDKNAYMCSGVKLKDKLSCIQLKHAIQLFSCGYLLLSSLVCCKLFFSACNGNHV